MENFINKIISLAKRRGFIFPSSEIYGGFGSCYDFGPLGVEMKRNIKELWWDEITKRHQDIIGLDAGILMSPKVWEASGHLTAGFADELVECLLCHKRFKLDEIGDSKKVKSYKLQVRGLKCPECGGKLTKPRKFNLMMKTFVGPVEDKAATTYLRAETCQGIYVNFLNIINSMRLKVPFGIAQIGKAFRNEITPGNYVFRIREFEQMEMQYFVAPPQSKVKSQSASRRTKVKSPDQWFDYWKEERLKWYLDLGIKKDNLRLVEVPEKERAHYAKRQVDIEYNFPFGSSPGASLSAEASAKAEAKGEWKEIEGIHNRGDWDLSNHTKHSGQDLSYFDEDPPAGGGKKYIPHIIETSVGVERILLAFLCDAYTEVKGGRTKTTKATKEVEVLLKLDKRLAPIKAAVLPLVRNKPKLVKKAKEVYQLLKPHFVCQYDESGSIGRRYRRVDEIGVPFAVTVDFETLKRDDVTVRDRDTMKQERIKIKELVEVIKRKLNV